MQDVKVEISDAHGSWLGASIDTASFLEATLGEPDADLEAMFVAWQEQDEGRRDDYEAWLESIGWEVVSEDNVYNHENDLSDVFVYRVAQPRGRRKDWLWDDEVLVLVAVHRGGDVRGNYAAHRIYRPGECLVEGGFFTWNASWALVGATGPDGAPVPDEALRGIDESWGSWHSSYPSGQVEEAVAMVHAWGPDGADVTLKNGWRGRVTPWWLG